MMAGRMVIGAAALALALAMPLAGAVAQEAATAPAELSHIERLWGEADALISAGRYGEAEPVARTLRDIAVETFGEDNSRTAGALGTHAEVLRHLGRLDEAEALYRRADAILAALLPDGHVDRAVSLNNLGEVTRLLGRIAEAEDLHRRALAMFEAALPQGDKQIAASMSNLAGAIEQAGRLDEAADLFRAALALREKALPPDDPAIALNLSNLAVALQHLGRAGEAERLHRQTLTIYETVLPENHPDIATSLNNLAGALSQLNRLDEAERMHRRALAIREAVLPAGHPDIALSLSNLASVLQSMRRYEEAEALDRQALAIYEAALPENHPDTASVLNNLAMVLQRQERFEEAAGYHLRALEIREAALPADHPLVALSLSNLASVLQNLDQHEIAEAMHRRALAIQERALPQDHPDIAQGIENLAIFLGALKGDYEEALALLGRSADILTARQNRATVADRGWRERAFFRSAFGEAVWLRDGLDGVDTMRVARRDAFLDLQWERSGGAGGAIAAAMARARADPGVAVLARERDRALEEIRRLDDIFLAVSSDAGIDRAVRAQRLSGLRAETDAARDRLAGVDAQIARTFPAYAELAEGLPLPVDALMGLLSPDEVLVSMTPFGEFGLFYAYGHEGGQFRQLPGAAGAGAMAARLRCSAAGRLDPACGPAGAVSAEVASDGTLSRGAAALQQQSAPQDDVFDLDLAHELYNRLFPEEVRTFIHGKKLIVAPAPELMGLPWHLLVTEPPPQGWNAPGAHRARAYREARWLFLDHPSITVLPSVSALRALRDTVPARAMADRAYLGIGDPVLGRTERERAAPPIACAPGEPVLMADAVARAAAAVPGALFAGEEDAAGFALADPELVRRQPRLADTRCELEAVAASLGDSGESADLFFGEEASETHIRSLDESGDLARYRVLHFATHGLLGGELGLGEPGLVLTPPQAASARDDGILTASEIATLTLAADWVVLSACNTAAGSEADAEALSGLARSFFYAGAKSLLVSSWPVYSPAAVEITTRAFDAMRADPAIGRAEALTIAMRDTLAAATGEHAAHPAYWGPFLLVGEGAR